MSTTSDHAQRAGRPPTHRVDYVGEGLREAELAATPYAQAARWVEAADARARERDDVPEPRALSVATVDATGAPNVRTVLMRFFDERGPGFVTSSSSTKGVELQVNPHISASLTWPAMYRAIRFRGTVEQVDDDEVLAYWQSRPYGSRISAWASEQSQPAQGREQLEAAFEHYAATYPDREQPDDVPRPPAWVGYRIRATEVEFWAGRRNRLHDRLVFTAVNAGEAPRLDDEPAWAVSRRQP